MSDYIRKHTGAALARLPPNNLLPKDAREMLAEASQVRNTKTSPNARAFAIDATIAVIRMKYPTLFR